MLTLTTPHTTLTILILLTTLTTGHTLPTLHAGITGGTLQGAVSRSVPPSLRVGGCPASCLKHTPLSHVDVDISLS